MLGPGAACAARVEIVNYAGQFFLYRDGEPYFIRGGGGEKYLELLALSGGNSLRTWSTRNAQSVLDNAQRLGLTVTLGLWVAHEAHGFDYDDPGLVRDQLDRFTEVVKQFKDHPALLMWGIGNEVNLRYRNHRVWDAIQDIAAMIHTLDPDHPTMTVLAGLPAADIRLVIEKCPDIDALGVNSYAELKNIPRLIRESGWERAYVVTEWGNDGYWEVPGTNWGASIEQSSSQKAEAFLERYQDVIIPDSERSLGAYVFLWGTKYEHTPTWFGMFLSSGEETSAVGVMQYLWSGFWPENLAPNLSGLRIDGISADTLNIYLKSNQRYHAVVSANDPDGDDLELKWELRRENAPEGSELYWQISGGEVYSDQHRFAFDAPLESGPYRLYVFAFDGHNHAGTANIPFYVPDEAGISPGGQSIRTATK
ncbi:MAG: hypothetical protein L0Y43_03070 [Methylococcaceae bacterium]|nr:hypothetical protein [Methylococcaceae bacterium]